MVVNTYDNKPLIAIVAGGYSGEAEVSLRSAAGILSWIDRKLFSPMLLCISETEWTVQTPEGILPVDRNIFGFTLGEVTYRFAYAYITIHGTPGENGLLQGYLDMLGIPYNTGGVLCEALTFSKHACNRYLSTLEGVRVARHVRLSKGADRPSAQALVSELGLPMFIKPNTGGSSVATSRVDALNEVETAITLAEGESDEILLESFISGTEVTCGCYSLSSGALQVLPVTEVVTKNKFFDYDAKYKGQVEEITPARIPNEQRDRIQELTQRIYRAVDARGIIRVDYIIEADGLPTLLEVNTTPGMTPTSFIPQQVEASGLEMITLLTELILDGLSRRKNNI